MPAPTPATTSQPAAGTAQAGPATIRLSAGQRYHLCSGREAIILVQAGRVRVQEAPLWLGTQLLDIQLDLVEGQHYLIERSGWICLQASLDCEVLYYPAPLLGQVSLAWLARHTGSALQGLGRWLQRGRARHLPGGTKSP